VEAGAYLSQKAARWLNNSTFCTKFYQSTKESLDSSNVLGVSKRRQSIDFCREKMLWSYKTTTKLFPLSFTTDSTASVSVPA